MDKRRAKMTTQEKILQAEQHAANWMFKANNARTSETAEKYWDKAQYWYDLMHKYDAELRKESH
jgi:hypothetical protein